MQIRTPDPNHRLTDAIPGWTRAGAGGAPYRIGVLPGEGVGPEVIDGALAVLDAIAGSAPRGFEIRTGGKIGLSAQNESGQALTPEVASFCKETFAAGGAVLAGPGGSRFVYELRAHFDLYCKLIPIRPLPSMHNAGIFRPEAVAGVDMLIVRENAGGIYFGEFGETRQGGQRRAYHHFHYDESQVDRLLRVAVAIAGLRRGRLCVIHKPAGLPSISEMWRGLAQAMCAGTDIELEFLEVDTASYRLLADAAHFDVVAAPNLFGDVLADGAAALLGSRGMSFSANFGGTSAGVYQTAHGAAYDLAGLDQANPVGQIQSLAMMLRESFGLDAASAAIEAAIDTVLAAGWRTADIMGTGSRKVGTRELSRKIADAARLACAGSRNGVAAHSIPLAR